MPSGAAGATTPHTRSTKQATAVPIHNRSAACLFAGLAGSNICFAATEHESYAARRLLGGNEATNLSPAVQPVFRLPQPSGTLGQLDEDHVARRGEIQSLPSRGDGHD